MEPWSESLLAKLLRITPGAAPRNIALERFIRAYIIVAVTLALGGFFAWLAIGGGMLPAMQVLISVLVVSCPCASGVALPLTRDLATSQLRRLGVFIREGEVWTKLEQVRHVVFDKTGTLTLEAMTLLNPEVLRLLTAEESAVLLAMVQINPHPVSGCLREQLLADGVEPALCAAVAETIGFGLEVKQSGAVWKLGRPEWAGGTKGDCVFSRDGEVLAAFHFGEEARADAVEEIATLRHQGHRVSILSGDRREKVDAMADRLHLSRTDCHAEMTPEGKAEWITRNDHRDTLYIGDGANDSLAFDKAWCTGTPAIDRSLLEQKSDFYFLGRGLNGIRALFNTATTRRRTAQCVVAFAIAYNAVAIALCLFGRMNPLMAAILMPASSLVSLAIVFIGCTRKKQ
jgi:Cu2+-exporting ATPase